MASCISLLLLNKENHGRRLVDFLANERRQSTRWGNNYLFAKNTFIVINGWLDSMVNAMAKFKSPHNLFIVIYSVLFYQVEWLRQVDYQVHYQKPSRKNSCCVVRKPIKIQSKILKIHDGPSSNKIPCN